MDKIVNTSAYNFTFDIDFPAAGLIKYCNVHVDSCYHSLAEKFIDYLREIYKHCFYTKTCLVNLEGIKTNPIEGDRYIIVDKDLCVLDLSY